MPCLRCFWCISLQGVILSTATVAVEPKTKKSRRLPLWWSVVAIILVAVVAATFVPVIVDTLQNPDTEVHQPGLSDFFPDVIFGEGTWFEFNRLTLARVIAMVAVIAILGGAALTAKLRPTRFQVCVEYVVEFVRRSIGVDVLGEVKGRRYAKSLGFVFFGVLAMNLTGVVPGINTAASSVVAVPLMFALYVWVLYIALGIKARGLWRYLKEQTMPEGVPWVLYILLTPIEFISNFIVRPVSLTIRLLANMMAGHMLLAITYFGTQSLLLAAPGLKALAVLTFAGSLAVTCFELFVAVLQAYVFTILTAIYISLSVEAH